MLYPQNGDHVVALDSVTSLHTMYYAEEILLIFFDGTALTLEQQDPSLQLDVRFMNDVENVDVLGGRVLLQQHNSDWQRGNRCCPPSESF